MAVRFLLFLALLLAADAHGQDAPRPVSVQELSLLLRSGYTGDEVLRETAGRPLLAPLDAAAERALLDAGADARTVAALRADRRVASSNEATDAQQRQAAADQYRLDVWEADQARRAEAGRESMRAKLATRREEALKQVGTLLRDKLVLFAHNRLEPYDNATLAGKRLFLLYSALDTDKTSLKLTTQLAEFYRRFAPAHPEFETVFLSADGSAADMEGHLRQTQMPWPALAFDQIEKEPDLAALRRGGMPRLMLINGGGETLADNFEVGKPASSQRVLDVLLSQTAMKPPVTR